MEKYKGIKIPNKIIIVENKYKQGYVVAPDAKSSLETAISWGNDYIYSWDEELKRNVRTGRFDAIVNEYENGNFKVKLYESAGGSSQGGKLSFWNCTIVAPDNKEYIIGINSDLLLKLLMNTTVINGEVEGTVWLGKEKQNTGIYLPHMEDFIQARKEDDVRAAVKTSKYQVGDIVETLTEKEIYLGEMWQYIDINDNDYYNRFATIYKNPRKVHVFVNINLKEDGTITTHWVSYRAKKPARLIHSKIDHNFTLESCINQKRQLRPTKTLNQNELYRNSRINSEIALNTLQYTFEKCDINVDAAKVAIKNFFGTSRADVVITVKENW